MPGYKSEAKQSALHEDRVYALRFGSHEDISNLGPYCIVGSWDFSELATIA